MSAPSKEEIATSPSRTELRVAISRGGGHLHYEAARETIIALADENERLRAELSAALDAKATLMAEREQFRSLSEKQRALIAEQDADHAKLRAGRAECIALLERIFEEHENAPDYWDRPLEEIAGSAVALLAKLRGQQP